MPVSCCSSHSFGYLFPNTPVYPPILCRGSSDGRMVRRGGESGRKQSASRSTLQGKQTGWASTAVQAPPLAVCCCYSCWSYFHFRAHWSALSFVCAVKVSMFHFTTSRGGRERKECSSFLTHRSMLRIFCMRALRSRLAREQSAWSCCPRDCMSF